MLGMIDPEELDSAGVPLTARAVSYIRLYSYILFIRAYTKLLTYSL